MRNAPYDQIAGEYYDDFHKTCRNFDHATVVALQDIRRRISSDGVVLDIGAGKGRCREFLGIDPKRVIQLDNSPGMLSVKPREDALLQVLHDAESLPFSDGQFSCVAAFLCDPYLGLNFLSDVYRVLRSDGLFVATTPSYEWGIALRDELSIDSSETRFLTKAGMKVTVPSILVPIDRLVHMLRVIGFAQSNIEITRHRLPNDENPVSDDIALPARKLGCNVHSLDILYSIVALR